MARIWRSIPIVILSIGFAATSMGQAMLEHAAAAAGGSLGAVGGKKVSDAIDGILGKANGQLQKAADPKTATAPVVENRSLSKTKTTTGDSGAASKPRASRNTASKTGKTEAAAQEAEPVLAPVSAEAPVPPPVTPTAEALAQLPQGASSQDVMARLGVPASKITMDDGGHLLEIYQYRTNGAVLGTVRIVDGTVASVNPSKN